MADATTTANFRYDPDRGWVDLGTPRERAAALLVQKKSAFRRGFFAWIFLALTLGVFAAAPGPGAPAPGVTPSIQGHATALDTLRGLFAQSSYQKHMLLLLIPAALLLLALLFTFIRALRLRGSLWLLLGLGIPGVAVVLLPSIGGHTPKTVSAAIALVGLLGLTATLAALVNRPRFPRSKRLRMWCAVAPVFTTVAVYPYVTTLIAPGREGLILEGAGLDLFEMIGILMLGVLAVFAFSGALTSKTEWINGGLRFYVTVFGTAFIAAGLCAAFDRAELWPTMPPQQLTAHPPAHGIDAGLLAPWWTLGAFYWATAILWLFGFLDVFAAREFDRESGVLADAATGGGEPAAEAAGPPVGDTRKPATRTRRRPTAPVPEEPDPAAGLSFGDDDEDEDDDIAALQVAARAKPTAVRRRPPGAPGTRAAQSGTRAAPGTRRTPGSQARPGQTTSGGASRSRSTTGASSRSRRPTGSSSQRKPPVPVPPPKRDEFLDSDPLFLPSDDTDLDLNLDLELEDDDGLADELTLDL